MASCRASVRTRVGTELISQWCAHITVVSYQLTGVPAASTRDGLNAAVICYSVPLGP